METAAGLNTSAPREAFDISWSDMWLSAQHNHHHAGNQSPGVSEDGTDTKGSE